MYFHAQMFPCRFSVLFLLKGLRQITRLPSLGRCLGIKPLVGVAVALPVVNSVGMGEGISALCTSSQFITLLCIQVPSFDLPYKTRQHLVMSVQDKSLHWD